VFRHLIQFARRQDAEEIARQRAVLAGAQPLRSVLTVVAYLIALAFLPFWVAAVLAAVDLGAEWAGMRLLEGLVPERQPLRYWASIAAVVTTEAGFMTQAALLWQIDNAYAMAMATALVPLTLLQLSALRTIHMPYAFAGLITVTVISAAAVILHWLDHTAAAALFLPLVAVAATSWFALGTMLSNHRLHDDMARTARAAQAADRAKSRFLAQMSHELRTPLNAVLGLGHAEMAEATDPQRRDRLQLIVGSARSLSVLLDDILDLSAVEEGRLPIRPAPASPVEEIHAAAALHRPFFEAAGLVLRVKTAPDLPETAALDAQRLRQCLTNLLSNALKHTRQGGVQISARMAAPWVLEIDVADTGPGVRPDEAEAIFEPFRQGTDAPAGSGLGLSISRSLARAMSGDLRLLPVAGPGATFRLTLMIGPAAPRPAPVQPPGGQRLTGLRVLIVDDIATNRLVARTHLALYGLRCEEAADGATALARIVSDPPDLVLLDLNMPGMSGEETLRRLRALPPPASRVRVVAMTADAKITRRTEWRPLGFDGYLLKPLTPESVGEMLARLPGARVTQPPPLLP